LVDATIEPGVMVARHTHPGIESAYVLEGGLEVPIQGQPTRTIKPGDGFQIPPETPHAGGKPGETKKRASKSQFKVNRHAPSNQPTAFKYRRKRRMQAVNPVKRKQEFLSPTWWRRESP